MSMSIYYTAKRKYAMTSDESAKVCAIVNKYCSEYSFEKKYEDFCVYSEPLDEKDAIFSGATSIPYDEDLFYDVILYWLKCLSEITKTLPDCDWQVNLDDVALIWEKEQGWRLPTDGEYTEAN